MSDKKSDYDPKICVAIPRYGMGDILYTCLCLSFLKKNGIISEGRVFAPKLAVSLVELFGLVCVPYYSKILHMGRTLNAGIKNEWKFWISLGHVHGHCGFSLINDVFDDCIFKIGGLKKCPDWKIGNYCLAYPGGNRARINSILNYRAKFTSNPKHILARSLFCINQIIPCSLDDFWKYEVAQESKVFEDATGKRIVILPDAGGDKRQLTVEQVQFAISKVGINNFYSIFTNDKIFSQAKLSASISIYPSLDKLCNILANCDMIICSDSFGAHLAGLFHKTTFIIYQPLMQNHLKWEWWGLPHSKAYHLFNGRVFKLNRQFVSVECLDEKAEPLAFALARATSVAGMAS